MDLLFQFYITLQHPLLIFQKKYEKLISQKEQLKAHPKSKKIGIIIKNKNVDIKNNIGFIDSRFSDHLNVTEIKKILLKEKYLQFKSR